ncbi:hypothetical protein HCH_04232 [Hahella chejuensis KCTC 2396]|uniref:Uncharacterized protein n=1 Tax=Hahella chejuensis (strain KCTC 2396) TaxID=349521 RepID=Q2SEI5_HAHCH|nr:hypothetical protein HCH_04232 [Hahella chejuensis KCTC 2396]
MMTDELMVGLNKIFSKLDEGFSLKLALCTAWLWSKRLDLKLLQYRFSSVAQR